jgi:phage recombination protein Bet
MSKEIAQINSQPIIQWTEEQIATLTKTVAKDASVDELNMFLHLSKTYGLDPFAKEIWFIKMRGAPVIMTSRDGYLKIANNNPTFEGLVSDVVYEGDSFKKMPDSVDHQYGVNKRGKILGAYALVYRKNVRFPIYVFAPYQDYIKPSDVWRQYPHAMILKVAESMALKRAFSLSGLVSREEMDIDEEGRTQEPIPVTNAAPRQLSPRASVSKPKGNISAMTGQLWLRYCTICGNESHAKNAMLKITGDKPSSQFTQEDISALQADIAQRELELQNNMYSDAAEPEGPVDINFNAEEFKEAVS